MNMIRWEPFRELSDLASRPFVMSYPRWMGLQGSNNDSGLEWAPAVDISETDNEYLVRADLPAVKREHVKVAVEDDILTIRGERKEVTEQNNERCKCRETMTGSFTRSMQLPDNADLSSVRAESKDGVLTVHIRKKKVEKSRAIEIPVQ
jgi:HSP20 family protein